MRVVERISSGAAALFTLALPIAAAAQPAHLVADLAPGTRPGAVELFPPAVELAGSFYLAGLDRTNHEQLWRTDGTPGSLARVTSLDGGGFSSLIRFGGDLYFIGFEAAGTALWRVPAATGVPERVAAAGNMLELAPAGSKLVFGAGDPAHGRELWASDGTAEGTALLADLAPGTPGSSPGGFFPAGPFTFFFASAEDGSPALWRTDGTADGTVRVTPLPAAPPEGALFYGLGVVGGRLIFTTYEGSGRFRLWRSDGTAGGTVSIAELAGDPGPPPPIPYIGPSAGVAAGGFLYFAADDGVHGRELFRSDGSTAAPEIAADVRPGATGSSPSILAAIGDSLLFSASDASHGEEPWIAGPSGARLVRDVFPGNGGSNPLLAIASGGVVFFTANDGNSGFEIWRSDGTENGTFRVEDVAPGAPSSGPLALFVRGNDVFFEAGAGPKGEGGLWKADVGGGAAEAVDALAQPAGSFPDHLVDAGDRLFFATLSLGDGPPAYRTLWTSRGTPATTTLLREFPALVDGAVIPSTFCAFGGRLFFRADDGTGVRPWVSDGTVPGTHAISGFDPGAGGDPVAPLGFTPFGGGVVFVAEASSGGGQIWKTDGNEAVLLVDLGSRSIDPFTSLLSVGSELYFVVSDDRTSEIWKTDGSPSATTSIASFRPGSIGALVPFGGGFAFAVEDALWTSDGTAGGTRAVFTAPKFIETPTVASARGFLFFRDASDALWRSDGTAGGTILLAPSAFEITAARDLLFFTRDDGAHGRELWKTDGTPAGTALVKDIRAGGAGSQPFSLAAIGRFVYFSADDGAHGREPWRSDGTEAGTRLVADVAPGPDPSNPVRFTASGNLVYFSADDGVHGVELWAAAIPRADRGAITAPVAPPAPVVRPSSP